MIVFNQTKPTVRGTVSCFHQNSTKCVDKKRTLIKRSKTQLKKLSDCFQKTIKSLDEIAREDVKYSKELFEQDNTDVTVHERDDDPFDV